MRRIRRSQRRSSSSVSSAASTPRRSASGSGSNGCSSTRGGDEDAVSPVALGAALGEQRLGERLRAADAVARRRARRRRSAGCRPVDSCSSGIPSGASSLGESGSSRTTTSGVSRRSGWSSRRSGVRAVVTMRRGEPAAAAAQIGERGDRLGCRPSGGRRAAARAARARRRARRAPRAPRPRRTRGLGAPRRQLGQDLAERRQPRGVELDAGERFAERGRERHVRAGAARAREQLARPTRTSVELVAPARRAAASCRARPRPRSGQAQRRRRAPRRTAVRERVELGRRGRAGGARARRRLAGVAPDRARQQRADVLLADDRRLERPRLGGRLEPELLVEPHRGSARYAASASCCRPSA